MSSPGPILRNQPHPLSSSQLQPLTSSRNAHYPPHRHSTATTHLILDGNLTICYPEETPEKKEVFGKGEWLDVAKGRVHEVWVGEVGCRYVIGE